MNISQVPTASLAARRVWGEANVCLTHSPGTDGRTEEQQQPPALEDSGGTDSGRRSLGHMWMLVMKDTSTSPRMQPSPGGHRGARHLGGCAGTRAARLLGEGEGRRSCAASPHRSASWLHGVASGQPFLASPRARGRLASREPAALRFWFISSPAGSGGLGGPGPVWMVTCS